TLWETAGQRTGSRRSILRVVNGVLVEHWDVLQDEASESESKSGRSRSRSGVPFDKERARPTKRGVGLEMQRLSRYQAQAGKACAQFLQHDARLKASQRRAQAIMGSEPEGEVLLGVLPMDVEMLGVLEDRGIVVRRAEQQKQIRVGRDRHTA